MDMYFYTRILSTYLKKSVWDLDLVEFIFQQDNNPQNTSNHMSEYFIKNDIDVMDWPSECLDLNLFKIMVLF